MKQLILVAWLSIALITNVLSQSTQTSGNWSDPTVWSGGAVPAASGTVTVNNPTVIDGNLSPTGTWTFSSNATDAPGGAAYTFNPNAGTKTIQIDANEVVTFEGGTSGSPNVFSSGTIDIYGTLILGYTQLNNSGNLDITIEPGGTLIIYGDLINKNNSGTFTINGALVVYGNFANQTGSVTVGGTGTINTTGKITSTGGATVFGSTNDCNTGPCSGTTLTCSFTNTVSPASKTICNGSSAGTLTSTNSASSPSYQWLSSTDNISYANASGTSTNSTYVTPALTQTTWYKLKITSSSGPCTSTSAPVKISVLSSGGWLGGTSSDWGTASNWCSNSVPTSTTDVTITNAAGISNMPVINAGTTASCKNLTISNTFPASSLTIAASATASLNIYGDLTNDGTFTDNSSSPAAGVIMRGSAAQALAGSSATVFNNLTINNSGASPAINAGPNNLTVNSNLTLANGVVNLNGATITLGTSAANPGTLNYTAGSWLYGGNIVRWFPTAAVTLGVNASLFPTGSVANFRPMYFGSSGLSTAGTIKVSNTAIYAATAVSFPDGAMTVSVRTDSYWTVTTANGLNSSGTPFDVRTDGTGFGLIGNVSDLRLTLAGAAAPGAAGVNAGSISNPQVSRSGLSVANLANTFYWGSVDPGNTTLPIGLLSFSGRQQAERIMLEWQTGTDANLTYFAVERSEDGIDFLKAGEVLVAGGPTPGHSYTFTDLSPGHGRNYYRLKLYDLDGTFSYSRVLSIYLAGDIRFAVFPNPSDGRSITVQVAGSSQAPGTIDVFNVQGIAVGHANAAGNVFPVYFTPKLLPGVYFVKYSSRTGSKVKTLVVKD